MYLARLMAFDATGPVRVVYCLVSFAMATLHSSTSSSSSRVRELQLTCLGSLQAFYGMQTLPLR